jgi:anti-anti-sigma factor
MKVDIQNKNDIDIVKISGNLDSNSAPDLQQKVLPLLAENTKLILDMENCEYVSSAGLRVLLMVAKTSATNNGKTVLVGLSDDVREIMEMTGFGSIFPNFVNYKLAMESFEEEG